ncbi:hypothetical protein SCHPADRAFT_843341 [Schizopora paradoxa]|uniref:Chromo domain-containing protein n=1 Tax=Schizopora paradoxa TaxID=27342 RepID=A0A0H2S5K5_9AGAM|nr:hypothetical protein SCHPADRAFT_843341 [Schizopora paradoxa]
MSAIESGKRGRDDAAGDDSDSDVVLLSGPPSSASCLPAKRRRTLSAKAVALQGENGASRRATPTTASARPAAAPSCTNVPNAKTAATKSLEKVVKPKVLEIVVDGHNLRTTPVFDMFWRYAASRQELENRRRAGEKAPWTDDLILQKFRFCSVFRVSDAASQFLIREVIEKGSQAHDDVVFRVILFNIFTRIETFKTLDRRLGPLTWKGYDRAKFEGVLKDIENNGDSLYTGAFQKPAPKLGGSSNPENHLHLLEVLMRKEPNLVYVIKNCEYLADAYDWINCLPGMGDFTAHQLLLDLSYAGLNGKGLSRFHPSDFVVAGIGAVKGIEICYNGLTKGQEIAIMRWMCKNQTKMFARLGLAFDGLKAHGKSQLMHLCDIEHTLCEVYKYEKMVRSGAGKRDVAMGGKARKFEPKHTLEREATIPKAWSNPSRKVERVKPGKFERVGKEYVVKALLDRRPAKAKMKTKTNAGSNASAPVKYEYLVDWLGYGVGDRTWEPEEMLREDAPQMVDDFEREKRTK